MRLTRFTAVLIFSTVQILSIEAKPIFARQYKQQFGYMPSCLSCHADGGGSPLNNYGKAFKDNGSNLAAFAKIAALDSDGDGANNEAEAKAKSNPGDKNSTPAKAGAWLDTSSLIPKEVRASFSTIQTWQIKDAILTPADIETAKKMGATLSAADENTIYIPVENQYPVGTAIIFPVAFQGKNFYLLMTAMIADKQLKIKQVQVLDAREVPAAKTSKIYSSFIGQPIQSLPAKTGAGIDEVIHAAVKNAGVLVYVRLKGA